ncbi:Indoleamine 2,3-dioxygenase [Auriscalpium vulgare]|uniref:Indoleamine 2,3-dioxygenase n=1 Tax=Auriscalpium vulgare TaxID=40419 RepID=A0ACB8S7F1_9AGAM|nr:Indoleamine 2,3-dioxygenase [Auriscalpium vulgare]
MTALPPNHFLALPRPDVELGPPAGVVDTTTLAAHDFDVDTRTGFMPPQPPLARLPDQWAPWEDAFAAAQSHRFQLGRKSNITDAEKAQSEAWRAHVRQLPTLPTTGLLRSELLLRRAHHVLSWTMHFYVHSLPPDAPIRIPAPITVPLLQVSHHLQLPPVVTYSDDVLYNWALLRPQPPTEPAPALDNLRTLSSFTGTRDEAEFYLTSARIELRGVAALEVMRATLDELFVGDAIARARITRYMHALAGVIDELAALLVRVREGCEPETFYRDIRPWFNGVDSDAGARGKWVFEGLDENPEISAPTELSGPSAGQSSIVHALDIFLGVDHYSHASALTGHGPAAAAPSSAPKVSFLDRMQVYMPRHHRNFLRHLSTRPRSLRSLIEEQHVDDPELIVSYNAAVAALKRFRDAHMRIVALYIIGPARRLAASEAQASSSAQEDGGKAPLKGTGGTDLVRFLKDVRDNTVDALVDVGVNAS